MTSLDLETFLPYRLAILSSTVSEAIAQRYSAEFQLTIPEWRVIALLGRFQECPAQTLVAHGGMDKVTVSRAVASLVDRGRVARRTDPDDKRRTLLSLTPAGKETYARIVPTALGFERELVNNISPQDRDRLDRLLQRLLSNARARMAPKSQSEE